MSIPSMLQLLQGPTRLAVGVLSGAAAADLLLSPTAHCYVYRPPYDDEAFQSVYGTPSQRALATSKPKRPVGQAALAKLATPSHVAITFGRNIGLTVLVTFNRWLVAAVEEMDAAEEEGREPETPPLQVEDLGAAFVRGAYNACVDLAVQATRCVLDAEAVKLLPAELAKRLIKDLRLSVVRKARLPWYARTVRVARTALHSEATWWAADFVVSCALEAYAAARKSAGSWAQRVQRLLLRCGLHAVRAGLVLVAVSAGYGVGSAAPGLRGLSTWACSMAASFLVNGYMLSFINRLAPLAPAGGDGGAAAAAVPPGSGARAGGGIMLVGQQMHPAAAAAMAAAAAAAAAGGQAGGGQVANGVGEPAARADAAAGPDEPAGGGADAGPGEAAAAAAAAAPPQQQDAGVQAGAPGVDDPPNPAQAAEPPIPAPQQRRVVGGPRLPDRPARRNAAGGAGAGAAVDGEAPAAAARGLPLAPPPAAPHTPQFRDQRAPTPPGDSEEAESRAAAVAAASPAGSAVPGTSSSDVPAASGSTAAGAGDDVEAAGQAGPAAGAAAGASGAAPAAV